MTVDPKGVAQLSGGLNVTYKVPCPDRLNAREFTDLTYTDPHFRWRLEQGMYQMIGESTCLTVFQKKQNCIALDINVISIMFSPKY